MEHIDYAYTQGMDDDEIKERLHTSEAGVLSLSRESDAYAVPLAHYYDGDISIFASAFQTGAGNRNS